MTRLLKRTFNVIILLLVVLIIALAAIFIRLSTRPMDAAFLVNFTHQYLPIPQELSFAKTQLFWPKGSYGPELILTDARWDTKTGAIPLGNIGIATDFIKLVNGDFALAKVSFRNIRFEINDGDFRFMKTLLQPQPQNSNDLDIQKAYTLLSRLGAIVIEDAHIAFYDTKLDQTYYSPKLTASLFAQDDQIQLLGLLSDQYHMLKNPAQLYASLNKDNLELTGKFYLEHLDLKPLDQYLNKFITINQAENINIAAQLSGNFQNKNQPILDVNWQLRSHDLSVDLPKSKQPTEIKTLNADGLWSLASGIISLKSIELETKEDGGLIYDLAIKNIKAAGYIDLAQKYINIANLYIQSQQDSIFNASYKTSWLNANIQNMRHAISIESDDLLSSEEIVSLWPEFVAKAPRKWFDTRAKGQIYDLFVGISFFRGDDKIIYTNLDGSFKLQQGIVKLNEKLPAIENIAASVDLDGQDINILMTSATSSGIDFEDAKLTLSSVHHKKTAILTADIPLDVSAQQALTYGRFLNPNLLSFIEGDIKGSIQGNIGFNLALAGKTDYAKLSLADFGLSGNGSLTNLDYPAQQFSSEKLDYALQNSKIQLKGSAKLQSLTFRDVDLVYPFDLERSWSLKAKNTVKVAALNKNFLQLQPVIKQLHWQGTINSTIALAGRKSIDVTVNSNLSQSSFEAKPLGFAKASGKPATLIITTKLQDQAAKNINLNLTTDKIKLSSSLNFNNNQLQLFEISELSYAKTQLTGKYIPLEDKNILNLSGNLDLSSYEIMTQTNPDNQWEAQKPLEVSLELDTVYLQNFNLIKVQAAAAIKNNMLYSLNVAASTSDNTPFVASITPQNTGRKLSVKSQNGGRIIKGFNIYAHIKGGALQIEAFSPFEHKNTWSGTAEMYNFSLVKAPVLTHLLGALNLIQLNGSLSGDGLLFEKANVPFTLSQGTLTIKQAEVIGPSLAVKADGTISFIQDNINLTGQIIPFSMISGITSQVPILGELLSGANKDGIFVADFKITGKQSDPQVTTYPLNSIAPGIIRDIFKTLN